MTKINPITFVCAHCESTDVLADAYAEWDESPQKWEVASRFDKNAFCTECEEETTFELDLVYCDPIYTREIEEYGTVYLPEDTMLEDISPNLQDKIDELNAYITKEKIILSWSPGKHRTEFEE